MEKITVEDPKKRCRLCHRSTVDELNLGPLYAKDGIICHYFCMLFTSNLKQRGKTDEDGILGFLPEDILEEIARVSKPHLSKIYTCAYCSEKNPTIGCCCSKCRKVWHFPCGLEAGANYQFLGRHESFCSVHSKAPTKDDIDGEVEMKCPICIHRIKTTLKNPPIYGQCCNGSVFHKICLQRYALNAGYFFKCPTCTNKTSFRREVQKQGVFIPKQDASWELEPNAFQDLLESHSRCDANDCECPQGRNHCKERGPWRILRCNDCGATGTHAKCDKVTAAITWQCAFCRETEAKLKRKRLKTTDGSTEENDRPTSSRNVKTSSNSKKSGIQFKSIKISDSCRDYFPFTRQQIIQYGKKHGRFPDWTKRRLRVNLVDFFVHGKVG